MGGRFGKYDSYAKRKAQVLENGAEGQRKHREKRKRYILWDFVEFVELP
jgi:hypothetical protein